MSLLTTPRERGRPERVLGFVLWIGFLAVLYVFAQRT